MSFARVVISGIEDEVQTEHILLENKMHKHQIEGLSTRYDGIMNLVSNLRDLQACFWADNGCAK